MAQPEPSAATTERTEHTNDDEAEENDLEKSLYEDDRGL